MKERVHRDKNIVLFLRNEEFILMNRLRLQFIWNLGHLIILTQQSGSRNHEYLCSSHFSLFLQFKITAYQENFNTSFHAIKVITYRPAQSPNFQVIIDFIKMTVDLIIQGIFDMHSVLNFLMSRITFLHEIEMYSFLREGKRK